MRRTKKQLQEEIKKFNVYEQSGKWYGNRLCPDCNNQLIYCAQKTCLVLRNIRNAERNKSLCDKCRMLGELNPFFGKKHSEESKKQTSKSRTGKACGINNSMANPIHRKSVSMALKEKYKSGALDFQKQIQREHIIRNIEAGKMRTAPVSAAEKEIKTKLEAQGLTVISQFRIGTLKYDLMIKEKNVLIEYQGDYWHCNPEKYTADYLHTKKQITAEQIWNQDKLKKEIAEKSGYKLFIIWESDYMFQKEKTIKHIINQINDEQKDKIIDGTL